MNLLNEVPVTLVVKAPNQKVADQTVECALNWTVRKLKEHLARVYPSNPTENQQKIIYSGKLLQDDVTLKDVLRQHDQTETVHTVHLVCSNSSTDVTPSQITSNTTSSPSVTTTEGLRCRRTAPSEMRQQLDNTYEQQLQTPEQSASASTNVTERLQLPSSSAFQPLYHNPFVSSFLPPSSMGTATQTPGNGSAYSMEQMIWLQQQAYVQYMTSYMQFFQQGTTVPMNQPYSQPISPFAAPANQNAVQNEAEDVIARPPEAQQPPVVRMNAQGGPVDDDDDEMDRDWLDWFYVGVRFALLMCILYFYSTPTRLVLTLLLMLIFYLVQVGWFRVVNRRRDPQAAAVNPPPPPAPSPPPADPNEDHDSTPAGAEAAAPEEQRPLGGLALAWSVFLAFFTSLAPQPPPPVNAN